MRNLCLLLLIAVFASPSVWSANSVTAETQAAKKKWRLNFSGSHMPKLRDDQEDLSFISGIGDYFLNDRHRFRISQTVTKLYSKYSSEYEFQPLNTRLFHYYNIKQKWNDLSFIWRSDLALPISDLADRTDLVTSFTGMLFINGLNFFDKRLILSFRPFGRYNWHEFKTTAGGDTLPRATLGAVAIAVVPATERLSVIASGAYTVDYMENSQFDPNNIQREQGLYSVSLTVDYGFLENYSAFLSYSNGPANYIVNGRYEVAFYDPLSSRFSLGLAAIF